jgi:hypothetical protein
MCMIKQYKIVPCMTCTSCEVSIDIKFDKVKFVLGGVWRTWK